MCFQSLAIISMQQSLLSTCLLGFAPAVMSSAIATCADPASNQQRDVKKEKGDAMNTILQDGMRVTAANRRAWIEICQCPLSLVQPLPHLS